MPAFVRSTIAPAAAFVLSSLKSCTLPGVPSVKVPAKLLACVDKSIFVSAADEVIVVVPSTVSAPVWVSPPVTPPDPVITDRLSEVLDVPKTSAFVSVIDTANAPVLVRDTAPLKSLVIDVSWSTPAPELIVTAPVPVVIDVNKP